MSAVAMVQANSVTKQVNTQEGNLTILHPISLSVMAGESLAIPFDLFTQVEGDVGRSGQPAGIRTVSATSAR